MRASVATALILAVLQPCGALDKVAWPLPSARLTYPMALAYAPSSEDLYVAAAGDHRVMLLRAAGRQGASSLPATAVAGDGSAGFAGDGGVATAARLNAPYGVAVRLAREQGVASVEVYIADTHKNRVRCGDGVTGVIQTVAGNGERGWNGDNVEGVAASLNRYG